MVGMELLTNTHHIRVMRWISGVCLRFGNILSKMASFADFNRPILDIWTNLQKKYLIGEAIFLVRMGLLNNAHHIRELDLGDLPQVWK